MPTDHKSAAAGLSGLSPSSSPSPALDRNSQTPSAASAASHLGGMDTAAYRDSLDAAANEQEDADNPPLPWVRSQRPSRASRRLSTPYSHHSSNSSAPGLRAQLSAVGQSSIKITKNLYRQSTDFYGGLTPTQQFLVLAALVLVLALAITLLIFSHRIFTLLSPVAKSWRALPAGWLIVWALIFITGFPPIIGYSTACTIAGFVYRFPLGWPIAATATVAGSTAAFLASRTVLAGYVDRLVGQDRRFVALGQVLRHDGLGVLALVRFCPLPYSLSNGFLATVPAITPASFAMATAFASPKLLVHVFIGSRLALLAEKGDEMGFGDRMVNYISMLVSGAVGVGVGYFIFRRTMARAAELAREEDGGEAGRPLARDGGSGGAYVDDADDDEAGLGEGGGRLMDPNDAAALMVDDDDISLWDSAEGWEEDGGGHLQNGNGNRQYRDDDEEGIVTTGGNHTAKAGDD